MRRRSDTMGFVIEASFRLHVVVGFLLDTKCGAEVQAEGIYDRRVT